MKFWKKMYDTEEIVLPKVARKPGVLWASRVYPPTPVMLAPLLPFLKSNSI